jgi:hypothetical protein
MSSDRNEVYSFGDDAYLLPWQLGVAYYMQKRRVFSDQATFTGYGSGQLTATALACDINLKHVYRRFVELVGNDSDYIRWKILLEWVGVDRVMTDLLTPASHELASQRLLIPVTGVSGATHWISMFDSPDAVVDAHKASIMILGSVILTRTVNIGNGEQLVVMPGTQRSAYHDATMTICHNHPSGQDTDSDGTAIAFHAVHETNIPRTQHVPKTERIMRRMFVSGYEEARAYFRSH